MSVYKKKRRPPVGSRVATRFSPEGDGKSTVLAVTKYTGIYPQWFSCVVRVTSRTVKGWSEMAW